MRRILVAVALVLGVVIGVEAAPTDVVTQADLKVLLDRLAKLEAENKAQAAKIAELEASSKTVAKKVEAAGTAVAKAGAAMDEGTTTNETGRIFTTEKGFKYYLADKAAGIFEPLSESGLKITPYGYLVLEGVYSSRDLAADYTTDWVNPRSQKRNHTTMSVQDSIFGIQFDTPEANHGWTFTGRAEFDLVDTATCDQNHYGFHWRHLYVDAKHEDADGDGSWSILGGQTWHLWKIVTPSEIDGAWMENAGHPYRRSPQIRVTRKWDFKNDEGVKDSSFELRLGVVKGGPGMGEDRDDDGIQDNTASPWVLFEAAAIYDHVAPWQKDDRRWLVGLGGMYGRNRSHRFTGYGADGSALFNGEEDDYDSMMGLFALSLPMGPFTLTGQFYGGENLGGIQAGVGQTVAYNLPYARGNEVRAVGGFVDLGYKLNDDWSFAVGWGCDNPINSDIEDHAGTYDILYNDRAYVCAFYQVVENFKLGLEYARLLTSFANSADTDGGDYDADRVQFSAFYDF